MVAPSRFPRPRRRLHDRRRSLGMPNIPSPAPLPAPPPLPLPPPTLPAPHHLGLQTPPESDRGAGAGAGPVGEVRAPDCNLAALCEHIRAEGFNSGTFSDVVVEAMGSMYRLHRLILSRSSYFRNMLHGPWKEAGAPTVVLHIDDLNVNSEAIAMALAYLYGFHPQLNDSNAFRVLAAASFLDLQDLCAICTDFIISELRASNFYSYQVFAESQDYGIHGERVRNACWGYLCQSATMELREVLPKLSSQTLHALLTSDELWVPNEEKRFELAFYTLLAKDAASKEEISGERSNSEADSIILDSSLAEGKIIAHSSTGKQLESELGQLSILDNLVNRNSQDNLVELADCAVDFHSTAVDFHSTASRSKPVQSGVETARMRENAGTVEGSPEESTYYQLNNNFWLPADQTNRCSSANPSNGATSSEWGRCNMPSWGGRIVGRRQSDAAKGSSSIRGDEFDAFMNVFEGGSLLYCNMSFEALLNVRKQLEELGFPCKAVNDGLWLQMLLCHRVQAIGADTCRNCCLTSNVCACRQAYGYSHGGNSMGYYRLEHDRSSTSSNMGSIYVAEAQQGDGSSAIGPMRVHVRGAIDGLAGIGRGGTAYVPGDGLTALVGLSQGNNIVHVNSEETEIADTRVAVRYTGAASVANASGTSLQMAGQEDHSLGNDWECSESSSISLDLKTPLRHFPPFRFGVEFEDVHRLTDGLVKHSPEVFYAGSLWKVSVQAFNDEDPQGRRTLGLFLHRRKAEVSDPLRKVHMYIDSREKVTARYQLICPSKREVLVFGSFKQAGTLLPKAPKGWGWRTAFLFDELADLLQGGSLRIAAVVQLV